MEKEQRVGGRQDPLAAPGPEFLRAMELLENVEMLRMMQEFELDGPEKKELQGKDSKKSPGEGGRK